MTIRHAFGETTIEEPPTRIVTLGEDLDTLAALGITPVGYAPTAPGYTDDVPYLADGIDLSGSEVLEGADTGEFSLEQVAALRPDLILGTNLFNMDKLYGTLSQIAPTIGYETGWGETSWQEMSVTVGRAVGDEAGARAAVADTEDYLADLRAELPGLEGKSVASVYYFASGTFAANPRSASMDKYAALGMHVSPTLLELLPEGASDNSVSMERIEALDADYLVVSFGGPTLRNELESDPLYQGLDVVKRGNVHENDPADSLPTFAGNNPTLLNIPWLLDQEKEDLAKVAAGR